MISFKKLIYQNIFWILLLLLTIPSYVILIRPGFFPMQDDLQAFRIQQMDKCFADFQIPCRWVPDAGYQYGYPQFNYYPPSVYYLGEIFHLAGFQFIDSVKILFILGFVLSAITMFVFLRSWLGDWPALIGALMYTYAPYKAVDVYVRGAMSEFWSFVFFPLIFWSIYQLIKTAKLKYLVWMATSIGLLLITHNLMSLIFLPIVVCWALTWIILEKKWKMIPHIVLGGVLGIGLAAFFTLPVIVEKPYAHIESMFGGYFDWRQHFVDINQLFISNHWGYGSSYLGPGDDLSLSTGVVHWIAGLLALILSSFLFRKNKKLSFIVWSLAIIDILTIFLTHQKSSFIWEKIELLTWLQFPWRILADSVFLLSVLGGVLIYTIKNKRLSIFTGCILIITILILHLSFFQPQRWFNLSDKEKFSGNLWEKQLTISIFDYLPIYAKLPPNKKASYLPEVLDGKADFITYQKGSNYQLGRVKVYKEATLRLPLFDFPGMEVKIDNQKVIHRNDDCRGEDYCFGLIAFKVSPGFHKISAGLTDTPIRKIGNIFTIISIIGIGFIFFKSIKNEKNS